MYTYIYICVYILNYIDISPQIHRITSPSKIMYPIISYPHILIPLPSNNVVHGVAT